jgi:hypothetical protein
MSSDDYPDWVTEVREATVKDSTVSSVFVVLCAIQVGDFIVAVFSDFEDARKALANDEEVSIARVPKTLEEINEARLQLPEGEADLHIKKLELV